MESVQEIFVIVAGTIVGLFGIFAQHISYVARPLTAATVHAEVIFVGDMMFDRTIRQKMDEKGADYILSCIKDELDSADFVVANLEGPITSNSSKSAGSKIGSPDNFSFTFPLYVADMLDRHNIRVVSLGNNHILNFGYGGLRETKQVLSQARVEYFGEPGDLSVHEIDERGVSLTFIGFNLFDSGSTASSTIAQIRDARERGRLPIVFAHWGDEYAAANAPQKRLAHRFVDAGAEMVIGAHPHVIQEHELYAGKHVYYSLGNFVFDQYWKDEVRTGLLVRVKFDSRGVAEISEKFTYLGRDRRTCVKQE